MMNVSLADAIIQEDVSQVREFFRHGVNLNQWDEYGFTPLIEAAIVNNIEIGKLLIDHGADVNLKDATGGTPLQWTVENNNLPFSELLLKHGADANAYNFSGQPVLFMPLLRQQTPLKKLLSQYGANLEFAQDYLNTKLLGHMYELVGTADIVDPNLQIVEVDFEGFYLEVTLGIIAETVDQFNHHFAARQLRRYSPLISIIVDALARARQLVKYQQYLTKRDKFSAEIDALMNVEPLIIPVGYEGHAITFIKSGNILVKCDRREDSRLYDNVVFYRMGNLKNASRDFFKNLIYEKNNSEFINEKLHAILDLHPITEIKVAAQISGNCSWANVEACIPAIFFLLFSNAEDFQKNMAQYKKFVLNFFEKWREWNKERGLNFCIQSFRQANSVRKACKAEILAAILFQSCSQEPDANKYRIEAILGVLMHPEYKYILDNYVRSYCYESQSDKGKSFLRILKNHGYLT